MGQSDYPWSALPERIQPQLLMSATRPPAGDWHYEIKYDGYRFLARIGEQIRMFTRNGFDWTSRLPVIASELSFLPACAWIDGEVVAFDHDGKPNFNHVQLAFNTRRTDDLVFVCFDLMFLNSTDLRAVPLEDRRERLSQLLSACDFDHVRMSETVFADPHSIINTACKMKLEGVVAKRAGSPYSERRSCDWLKIKCSNQDTFHVAGYTRGFGSLVLGTYGESGLEYAGRIVSGLDARTVSLLREQAAQLARNQPPFSTPHPRLERLNIHWLNPGLTCDVKFAEITSSGRIRHGVLVRINERIHEGAKTDHD